MLPPRAATRAMKRRRPRRPRRRRRCRCRHDRRRGRGCRRRHCPRGRHRGGCRRRGRRSGKIVVAVIALDVLVDINVAAAVGNQRDVVVVVAALDIAVDIDVAAARRRPARYCRSPSLPSTSSLMPIFGAAGRRSARCCHRRRCLRRPRRPRCRCARRWRTARRMSSPSPPSTLSST